MGCSGSKLEDLEAVALCRGRTDYLANAIRHRYALADSHAAYSASLRSLAASLHRFFDAAGGDAASSSPLLSLPPHRKGDPLPPPPPAAAAASTSAAADHSRSHSSGSGSHIQFHSSDDDDAASTSADDDDHFDHDHHHLDIPNYYNAGTLDSGGGGGGPASFLNFHYARSQPPPPSVSYDYRPEIPQSVQFSDPSSSSSSYNPSNNYPNYSNYSYPYDYQPNYYGFLGGSSSAPPPPRNLAPGPTPSAVKPPPPPPSPPRASTWDFLNLFEGQDSYYHQSYTPSRSSREVRDEEGIPELEEEVNEVVKQVYDDLKSAGVSTSGEYRGSNEEGIGDVVEDSKFKGRRSVEAAESEEDVVEKKVVSDQVQQRPQQNVGSSSNPRKYHDVSEIGSEIRIQFERASDAVAELSKMLEVGKHPYYYRKSSVIEGEGSTFPPFSLDFIG